MEENKHTQLDAFLKKQIQEIPRDTPSADFTANLMNVIEAQESAVIKPYKPLISKPMWFVIAAAIIAVIIVPLKDIQGNWFEKVSFDVSFLNKLSISGVFDGLSLPTTAIYGMTLFTLMIFAQAFYTKGFFKPKASIL